MSPTNGSLAEDAIEVCRQILFEHSKSFALASTLLPETCRAEAAVVYAWCRRADDAIDRASPAARSDALVRLREELDRVYGEGPRGDLVLDAFREVVRRRRIPRTYPDELLAGLSMDASGIQYDSLETLFLYCFRVAGTVGLMMSHVMGVRSEDALRHAAHLGMAMQLTNICRDVLEDWELGRVYLPADLLAEAGAPGLADQLGGPIPESARSAVREVVRRLLAEAEAYYRSGEAGLAALSFRCAFAIRTASLVYAEIGRSLARRGYDALSGRTIVSPADKLALLARSARLTARELPIRLSRALDHGNAPATPRSILEYPRDVTGALDHCTRF